MFKSGLYFCIVRDKLPVNSQEELTVAAADKSDDKVIAEFVQRKDLPGLIRHLGLDEHEQEILRASRSSMRLKTSNSTQPTDISRLGGSPYLPESFNWPMRDGRALSFVAQLNLEELGDWAKSNQMPSNGILSFFYDNQDQPWGFDRTEKRGWRVLYFDGGQDLKQHEPPAPLAQKDIFKQLAVSFEEELTFPDFNDSISDDFEFTEPDEYFSLTHDWYQKGRLHRLLGYPQLIQNDFREECRTSSRMPSDGDADWELLLQIDSDEEAKMFWGDCGSLYFCIEKSKLERRNFDDCWLILQCY